MAADPNVVSLQNAINRFANYAGFAPVGVDGQLGPITAAGTIKSLAWVQQHIPNASTTATELIARLVLESGSYNLTQIQSSASGLATYLNQNANAAALPVAPQPAVASGGGSVPTYAATAPMLAPAQAGGGGSAAAASVVQAWQRVPTWGKVLGGVVAGLGLLWGVSAARRKTASA